MSMIQPLTLEQISHRLNLVPQYKYDHVTVSIDQVNPAICKPLRKTINPQKLIIANCILQTHLKYSIQPFHPIRFSFEIESEILNGFSSNRTSPLILSDSMSPFFLLPPILEKHDDSYYIIDGLHRLYFTKVLGYEKTFVLIVEGVSDPLPADAVNWGQLKCIATPTAREEKFENYREEYWRDLTKIFGSCQNLVRDDQS